MKQLSIQVPKLWHVWLWTSYGVLGLLSCHSRSPSSPETAAPIPPGQQQIMHIQYAIGFNVVYQNDYKILYLFKHYTQTQDTIPYLLLPAGHTVPDAYRHYPIIRTPVTRVITNSSTHLALLKALDAYDVVVGHASTKSAYDPKFLSRIAQGKVKEVGRGANTNMEQVISLNPDVMIAVGSPDKTLNVHATLQEVGIPVIYHAGWQETSLLGRAEWIKLWAALLNKEARTNVLFDSLAQGYDSLKSLALAAIAQPSILSGAPFKGTWYVPGGKSYVAQLIKDAGGTYPWNDTPDTGSIVVSLEDALKAGLKTDIWVGVDFADRLQDIPLEDPRLADFKAYQTGQVYNFDKRISPVSGANDYWESGMAYPNYILADLIKIMHPDLLPNYEMFFYRKLK